METEEDERGAGGKIKKSIRNSNNPTPYARQNQRKQQHVVAARGGGGGLWNLISGGATRLFPSFFSRTPIFNPHQTDAGEAKQDVSDEGPESFQNITRSNEDGRAPFEAKVSTIDTYMDVNAGNTLHMSSDGTGISEIEMMLKGKTLSRHDLNRLAEILRSKVAVQSDVGEGGKRQLDVPKGEAVAASLSQENLKGPDNEKEALYLNRVVGESSSPFSKSTSRLASASPIEIAKAYMGTRTSELGSQSVFGKEKKNTVPASDFLSKSPVPTLAQNSSVCWPGAMVEQSHSYLTPQTERVKVKQLQTPYSRPVHSRTTSKLEGGGDRSRDTLSTNLKQMQTPVYAASQVSRMGIYSRNDGFGSVGTFRRTHRKFHGTMTPKGTSSSQSAISGVSRKESFDASKHLLPMGNEILKPGASTSSNTKLQPVVVKEPDSVGVATVHFHSIDMARKILEHLDRTIPIPEKKSAELKLATSWRNPPPSESTNSIVKAPVGIPRVENSKSQLGQKFSNQEKENICLLNNQQGQTKSGEATNTVNTKSLGSSVLSNEIFPGGTSVQFNSKPSTELEKIPEFEVNRNEVSIRHDEGFQSEMNHPIPKQSAVSGQAFSMFPHTDASCKILKAPLKLSTHSFGNKPTLTSISINKPDPTSRISFDNGSGFTFPISASLASLFEPPTPSIIPSFSAKGLPLPKENNTFPANSSSLEKGTPSYNFGSQTADRTLVFSFASSGLSTPTDFSVPKFAFGSGKARMNFRSVGKDAICS